MRIIPTDLGLNSKKENGFFSWRGFCFWIPFSKCFGFYSLIYKALRVYLTRFVVWFCCCILFFIILLRLCFELLTYLYSVNYKFTLCFTPINYI